MHFTQGLHRALQQHPDRIAVRTRTFRELGDRAARLAAALQAFGMKTGDRVAMLALNADRYLDDHLAVPWGGGMLNPCNVRWNVAEIVYSLNDSSSTLLIVDDAFTGMVEAVRRDVPTLAHVIYAGERDAPAGLHDLESLIARATPIEDLRRTGDDLLGIFHTGGTTDFPKGVMISRQNLYASGTALLAEGTAPRGGVYLHAAPMFHLADFGISIPQHIAGNMHAIVQSSSPKAKIRSGGRANFGTEVQTSMPRTSRCRMASSARSPYAGPT